MSERPLITLRWSRWDRFRLWLHGRLYHAIEIIESEGGLLIQCSCGGHALVRRLDDGMTSVGEATCGFWARIKRGWRPWIPTSRIVRR